MATAKLACGPSCRCCGTSPPPPPPPPPPCPSSTPLPTAIHLTVPDGTALGGPCLGKSCQFPTGAGPGGNAMGCADNFTNQSDTYTYGSPPAGLNAYESAHGLALTTFQAWWASSGFLSLGGGAGHQAAMNWPYLAWRVIGGGCVLQQHFVQYGAYGWSDPQWQWTFPGAHGNTISPLVATSDAGGTCAAALSG